ncbi:MAG: hypothetical protein ABI318_11905, partial [Chthoniobacteraceae bacterium]
MKNHALISATLALLGAFTAMPGRAERIVAGDFIEFADNDIFDNGPSDEAEGVQIVNGRIVLVGNAAKKPDKPAQTDPAGDQVLELTDGSQLHGKLTAFGKSEIIWQRADTTGPLAFAPQEVKRIVLGGSEPAPEQKANATVKLTGGDWLTGDLIA